LGNAAVWDSRDCDQRDSENAKSENHRHFPFGPRGSTVSGRQRTCIPCVRFGFSFHFFMI
jgi:hypothetical protein